MKNLNQSLFPDIPEEIRAARIGTCYNSLSRKLMKTKIAIDPNRLKKGSVLFINGKGNLLLKMNSMTTETSEGSFFSLDANVKMDFLICSVSAGFSASVASSYSSNNQGLNCYCSYVYNGQKLQLLDYGSKELYNFMSDDFQETFNAIIASTDINNYFTNYMNFIEKYGDGCITELFLTSGSAFQINVAYSDAACANSSKYGGNFTVSTPWGHGGSVAAEFSKEVLKANSAAAMDLYAEQTPENTPTKNWCDSLMQSVLSAGFTMLSQKPELIHAYTGEGPKAPAIPSGTPSIKNEPKGKALDISEELKNKIMEEDGFKGTWEEYEEAQKKAYEELVPDKVAEEVLMLQRNRATVSPDLKKPSAIEPIEDKNTDSVEDDDPWNLGGYIPFAFKITPWGELFPQLNEIKLPTTFTSIYIAKLYIYYFTKLQFSSYLYFLNDVGGSICKNDAIEIDAEIYKNACNEFLGIIQNKIKNCDTINEDIYQELVYYFEDKVAELTPFYSKKVYDVFYEKYDFFIENSYGFEVVYEERGYICEGNHDLPVPFSLVGMLKYGARSYPIICNDGTIILADFFENKWSQFIYYQHPLVLTGDKVKGTNGFYYYNCKFADSADDKIFGQFHFYSVGFKDIPKKTKLSIRGLPMFDDLPFDEIKQFAKPNL